MRRTALEGPALLAVLSAIVVAVVVACLLVSGTGADGIAVGIRATARMSVSLFVLAFTASSLVALWPGRETKWLLRNRRYLGLAMAVSHFLHAGLIVAIAIVLGDAFWAEQNALSFGGGLLGYAFIIAMTLTSTDAAVARLGRRRWRMLHLAGMDALWGIFLFTYAGAIGRHVAFAIPTVALVAALGVRIAARRRAASRRIAVQDSSTKYA